MWQFHRTMIRPFFARDKVTQYAIFKKTADKAISRLLDRTKRGLSTDLQDLFVRYTFDSTVEFLFNIKFNTLDEDLRNPHNVAESAAKQVPDAKAIGKSGDGTSASAFSVAFEKAQFAICSRLVYGELWPLLEFAENKASAPMKIVEKFFLDVIERHSKTAEELKGAGEEELSLLDQLALSTDGV